MLHRQAPDFLSAVKPWNDSPAPASGSEEPAGFLRVSDGRRQTDPPGCAPCQSAEAFDQAEGLPAPVSPQEGMDLIDHNEAEIPEQGWDLHMFVDHQRFQGLRRDLEDPGGLFHELSLAGPGRIPVPAGDRDRRFFAQLFQTAELVVDQGLERRDVEHSHCGGRIFIQQAQDREKSGLRLSGGRRCCQQHILVRVEDRVSRRVLYRPQCLPARPVNIVLNKRRVAIKNVHSCPPVL